MEFINSMNKECRLFKKHENPLNIQKVYLLMIAFLTAKRLWKNAILTRVQTNATKLLKSNFFLWTKTEYFKCGTTFMLEFKLSE